MYRTDHELLSQVLKETNQQAFEELVLRHRKSAVKFAFRYTGDYHSAEDLAQEAFARLYVNRHRYGPEFEFRPYLLKIVRNLCIDLYRKRSTLVEKQLTEDLVHSSPTPEDLTLKKETQSFVHRILNSLSEHYRTALYLQEYEGLSYREIAKAMGIGEGQVRMLIYRGRKKLRQLGQKELRDNDV